MKNSIKWLTLVSLLLVVVMSFALVSCGGGDSTDTDPNAVDCTVTFKHADGSEEKVTVKSGSSATAPAAKQVAGYTVAWENVDLSKVTSDMTVNAVKTAIEYKIEYVLNGGNNAVGNPTTYTISESNIPLKGATLDGYDFAGWSLDIGGENKIDSIAAGTTGDLKLYANFELEKFEVNYNLNGGVNHKDNVASFDKETKSFTFKDPTKFGYTFAGWYSDRDFTTVIEGVEKGTEKNVSVFAKWTLNTYEVSYVVPEGLGEANPDNPSEYTVEDNKDLKDPVNVKTGYKFHGWYTSPDFKEKVTAFDGIVLNQPKLYAKIEIVVYNISYDLANGTNSDENPASYTVNDSDITLVNPTRNGYTFLGWFNNKDGEGEAVTAIPVSTLSDVSLFAKWEVNVYNITYVMNGGTNAETNPATYTVENVVNFATPTNNGIQFLGWYSDEALTVECKSTKDLTGDITLYARWFDANKDPIMLLDPSKISSAVANEGNTRADYTMNLFDGVIAEESLYSAGETAWYGVVGDKLTITFAEAISIEQIKVYATGNYTFSSFKGYDEEGNMSLDASLGAPSANIWVELYNGEPVMVKTLVIEITSLKWGSAYTHKLTEIEIYVTNPNFGK